MEFHAVVLCGPGKALLPFLKARSTGIPKALLPVANRPMIEYVLDWCERAFFPKITVVSDSESQADIQQALDAYKHNKTAAKKLDQEAEIVGSAEDVFQYTNSIELLALDTTASGEIIRHLHSSGALGAYKHVVLLPCDFITNLPPQVLIEAYRNRADDDVGVLVHYRNQLDIEDKKTRVFPRNYTIYGLRADGQDQLLDIYSAEDIAFHKSLPIRTQMAWKHSNATVSTKLLNSGVFFGCVDAMWGVFEAHSDRFSDAYFKTHSITKVVRDLARRSWSHSAQGKNVVLLTLPHQAKFLRANNLPVLMEANRYFLKLQAATKAQQLQTSTANIGADSLVGPDSVLGEKTNVKRSVVGKNCRIGKRVKLTGTLVLDNVTIEDDVLLENCIIGHHVHIQNKVRLTNCNVESTHEVAKGTQAKGDTLLCFTLEGLVEGDESAVESSLESGSSGSESDYDDFDDEYGDNSDGLFAY